MRLRFIAPLGLTCLVAQAALAQSGAPATQDTQSTEQKPASESQKPAEQKPGSESQKPAEQKPQGSEEQQPQPGTQGQDFELLAPRKAPDEATRARDEALMQQLGRRRTMLQLHQYGGYATMATLTVAVVLGQINYLDKYAGGGDTGRWMTPHAVAAFTAAGVFAATGVLAILAPSPLEKPLRVDTATLHKIAMAVATAGMVTQIVLGPIIGSKEGQVSQRDWALAHQIVGYTTLVATYTGFLVLTF